jgi:hypothetical protein
MKTHREKSGGICPSEPLQHLVHIGWLPNTPFVGERYGGGPQGCPRFPTLPFHSALPNPSARTLLPCPSFAGPCAPQCPTPPARALLPCHSLPAHALHWPMSPAHAFLHCPSLPAQVPPKSPISFSSCPRFPTLPLLACPQCPMPLLSPTALLPQLKGSLSASRCSNSRSPATSCSAGQRPRRSRIIVWTLEKS